jgi:hypothetical protein
MKNIKYHNGIQNAMNVIQELDAFVSNLPQESCWVESFDNCREQGLVLILGQMRPALRFAITVDRHSDRILVYTYTENAHPTNMIKEGKCEAAYFDVGDYMAAAAYIKIQVLKIDGQAA